MWDIIHIRRGISKSRELERLQLLLNFTTTFSNEKESTTLMDFHIKIKPQDKTKIVY